jgi:hypothetical protein
MLFKVFTAVRTERESCYTFFVPLKLSTFIPAMQTRGLIFIPDISGFTRFVNEVEIEHSRLIIQELLEILVDAQERSEIVE